MPKVKQKNKRVSVQDDKLTVEAKAILAKISESAPKRVKKTNTKLVRLSSISNDDITTLQWISSLNELPDDCEETVFKILQSPHFIKGLETELIDTLSPVINAIQSLTTRFPVDISPRLASLPMAQIFPTLIGNYFSSENVKNDLKQQNFLHICTDLVTIIENLCSVSDDYCRMIGTNAQFVYLLLTSLLPTSEVPIPLVDRIVTCLNTVTELDEIKPHLEQNQTQTLTEIFNNLPSFPSSVQVSLCELFLNLRGSSIFDSLVVFLTRHLSEHIPSMITSTTTSMLSIQSDLSQENVTKATSQFQALLNHLHDVQHVCELLANLTFSDETETPLDQTFITSFLQSPLLTTLVQSVTSLVTFDLQTNIQSIWTSHLAILDQLDPKHEDKDNEQQMEVDETHPTAVQAHNLAQSIKLCSPDLLVEELTGFILRALNTLTNTVTLFSCSTNLESYPTFAQTCSTLVSDSFSALQREQQLLAQNRQESPVPASDEDEDERAEDVVLFGADFVEAVTRFWLSLVSFNSSLAASPNGVHASSSSGLVQTQSELSTIIAGFGFILAELTPHTVSSEAIDALSHLTSLEAFFFTHPPQTHPTETCSTLVVHCGEGLTALSTLLSSGRLDGEALLRTYNAVETLCESLHVLVSYSQSYPQFLPHTNFLPFDPTLTQLIRALESKQQSMKRKRKRRQQTSSQLQPALSSCLSILQQTFQAIANLFTSLK